MGAIIAVQSRLGIIRRSSNAPLESAGRPSRPRVRTQSQPQKHRARAANLQPSPIFRVTRRLMRTRTKAPHPREGRTTSMRRNERPRAAWLNLSSRSLATLILPLSLMACAPTLPSPGPKSSEHSSTAAASTNPTTKPRDRNQEASRAETARGEFGVDGLELPRAQKSVNGSSLVGAL